MTCVHAQTRITQPKGYYSRLFAEPAEPIGRDREGRLLELGNAMRYEEEREGTLTPRVGFTYFGQFLGHDLSHDATPLSGPYLTPERTPNYRTPFFDLDHVYGGGPEISSHLYEGEKDAETFKVGSTTPSGYLRDLPVEHGKILIGDLQDARNLDNLILRQLHVIFLKFHNEAIRQLATGSHSITGIENLGPGTRFQRAQRLVRWHYQWIVRHDFLPRIVHTSVWAHRRTSCKTHSYSVPLEFSLAAFRFGHSMVRNAYRLNCRQKRVVIGDLMALGQEATPLRDDYMIEWGTFFDGLPTSGPQASSSFIDTSIGAAMHELTPSTIHLSHALEVPDPADLPARTLLRGARAGLPSGQEVAAALLEQGKIKPSDSLTALQLIQDTCNRSGSVLKAAGLEKNTPLFFYLLKEAELKAAGLTLGPIGSHIVSEVILGALEADSSGYLATVGPGWRLPFWRFPNGTRRQVNSIVAIIRLVGDDKLLPECEAHWRRFLIPSFSTTAASS